jgi:hypothetical protein
MQLLNSATTAISSAVSGLTSSAVRDEHVDLMDRLAWCWDARGLIALRKGELEVAVRHFDAAWRLGGESVMAEHLGQAYERMQHHTSDALSAYLVARSLTNRPAKSVLERITHLAGTSDLEPLFRAAQLEFARQRGILLEKEWPEGQAEFSAVLDDKGRPLSATMRTGAEHFRSIEEKLSGRQFPLSVPDDHSSRLVVRVSVMCPPVGGQCAAVVLPARPSGAARN